MWSRDRQGLADFARLLHELEDGTVRSVAFVVPPGAAWPMDAYELSFVARLAAERAGGATRVLLVTAENSPVEALGEAASEAVGEALAHAEIELVTGVVDAGSAPRVDRTVCLPAAHGPAIAGTSHDGRGFVGVDGHARSAGDPRVYAAGDATALTLKHSTLASSQATAAAEAIAAGAGAGVKPTRWSPVLYGVLTLPPHFPGARGSPWLRGEEPTTNCVWWPPGHVAGRHLAPYLAEQDRGVRPGLERHPAGLHVAAPVGGDAGVPADGPASAPSERAMRHDSLTRQLLALRRAGQEGEDLGADLKRRLDEVERHEREVVGRLEAAGYLSGAAD